jgi:hypothetical protein
LSRQAHALSAYVVWIGLSLNQAITFQALQRFRGCRQVNSHAAGEAGLRQPILLPQFRQNEFLAEVEAELGQHLGSHVPMRPTCQRHSITYSLLERSHDHDELLTWLAKYAYFITLVESCQMAVA